MHTSICSTTIGMVRKHSQGRNAGFPTLTVCDKWQSKPLHASVVQWLDCTRRTLRRSLCILHTSWLALWQQQQQQQQHQRMRGQRWPANCLSADRTTARRCTVIVSATTETSTNTVYVNHRHADYTKCRYRPSPMPRAWEQVWNNSTNKNFYVHIISTFVNVK